MSERTCEDCRFALSEDYGYSNWTVEGTYIHCLKRLHPVKEGFDRWYGTDKRLLFAAECNGFEAGGCISVDIDNELIPWNKGLDESDRVWWKFYIDEGDPRRDLAVTFEAERGTLPSPAPTSDGQP